MALATFSLGLITLALTHWHPARANDRHAVYWNSSNLLPRDNTESNELSPLLQQETGHPPD
ncbi:hypothetical protein EYF80_067078 [Liparis tanakae]|uniref:Uncharacterized protein n=1 Tax=Liparis tanakae TaxID=230148 RepID=A0A4Z2E236_9TELE|nr:hypothetical protein EYF80_067078 [Liparis tanakae]